jgi:hypothetical protein
LTDRVADSTDPLAGAMAVLLSDAAPRLIGPVLSKRAAVVALAPRQVL